MLSSDTFILNFTKLQMEGDAEEGPGSYKQTKFSSWRRTIQIYAFALNFAFRYWRLGKKRTYRKMEVCFVHVQGHNLCLSILPASARAKQ